MWHASGARVAGGTEGDMGGAAQGVAVELGGVGGLRPRAGARWIGANAVSGGWGYARGLWGVACVMVRGEGVSTPWRACV